MDVGDDQTLATLATNTTKGKQLSAKMMTIVRHSVSSTSLSLLQTTTGQVCLGVIIIVAHA